MNSNLAKLQPYPFEKLARLKDPVVPEAALRPIVMSIGEPKHIAPKFIQEELSNSLGGLSFYPNTQGAPELRETIAKWLERRFHLKNVDSEQNILPCNGTREALFAIAQCVVEASAEALVMMPNPFYQVYEGAALLAGAKPWFVNLTADTDFRLDFESVPEACWGNCQLVYLCSPNNPTGTVVDRRTVEGLIQLADKFDFVIAADECYSEIYQNEEQAPKGLLEIAQEMGRDDYSRCLVFHSLSKRSSVPGLRSGFVAGDKELIEKFRLYRTYQGCAMAPPTQRASTKAWQDEEHVKDNRAIYRQKFKEAMEILSPVTEVNIPDGGFYLWLKTPGDDQEFARELYRQYNVTVLPGSYLSRTTNGIDPGKGYVRIALVPPPEECAEAFARIRDFARQLKERQ